MPGFIQCKQYRNIYDVGLLSVRLVIKTKIYKSELFFKFNIITFLFIHENA